MGISISSELGHHYLIYLIKFLRRRLLDCGESVFGDYFDECEVEVFYDLATNYRGDGRIDVELTCDVEIEYQKSVGFWGSDSESEWTSTSLRRGYSESGSIDFDFSFSSLSEVNRVNTESVECRIDDLSAR